MKTLYWAIENGCAMEGVVDWIEEGKTEVFNLCHVAAGSRMFVLAKYALNHGCSCHDKNLRKFLTALPQDINDSDIAV